MLRVISSIAIALCLLGCDVSGEVPLLTGSLGCYAGGESGPTAPLVIDPTYGTSFAGRPVMWPLGYTARRFGNEVVVLDAKGNVKATTGRIYHISLAYSPALVPGDDGSLEGPEPTNAFPAAVDCGYEWDFVDCSAPSAPGSPAERYCS
jgi:hypothetical protein